MPHGDSRNFVQLRPLRDVSVPPALALRKRSVSIRTQPSGAPGLSRQSDRLMLASWTPSSKKKSSASAKLPLARCRHRSGSETSRATCSARRARSATGASVSSWRECATARGSCRAASCTPTSKPRSLRHREGGGAWRATSRRTSRRASADRSATCACTPTITRPRLHAPCRRRAFTVGTDIYFGSGEYNPGTRDGAAADRARGCSRRPAARRAPQRAADCFPAGRRRWSARLRQLHVTSLRELPGGWFAVPGRPGAGGGAGRRRRRRQPGRRAPRAVHLRRAGADARRRPRRPRTRTRALDSAVDRLGLDALDAAVLAVCAAPELHPRYGRLYAYLQDDVTRRLPSPRLVASLLAGDGVEPHDVLACFAPDARLVRGRRGPAARARSGDAAGRPPGEALRPAGGVHARSRHRAVARPARRSRCAASRCSRDRSAATTSVADVARSLQAETHLPLVVCGPDAPAIVAAAAGRAAGAVDVRDLERPERSPTPRSPPRSSTRCCASTVSRTSMPPSARGCSSRSTAAANAQC